MIKLYDSNETQFNHNGYVLINCISCNVYEDSNGLFNAEFVFPYSNKFSENMIITANTPRGEQYFRIVKPKVIYNRQEKRIRFIARHISYDLLDNFIENIRPTALGADAFLKYILNNTAYPHKFTGKAIDIQGSFTANYVRKNPIECLIGNINNSFVNLFGGDIERDNFTITMKGGTRDNGYRIEAGKNLTGIEIEVNTDNVTTRLYPTVVIKDNVVTTLPEKYVDSPLINKYPNPIIKEYRIELTDAEKLKPITDIYAIMRSKSTEQFTKGKVDEPEVNYKVDFVMLEKTEQYKIIKILNKLNINDTATIYVPSLGIDIKAKFIKYKWNALAERYENVELGNFRKSLTNQQVELKATLEKIKENTDGAITSKLKEALDKIIGNTGGYQKILYNEQGLPQGTIWMDTPNESTAQNYIIINNQGIAFGNQGLSVPPTVAIGIDGKVAGDSAFFNAIYTNLIQSELGTNLDLSSNKGINLQVQDINQKIDNIQLTPGPQGIPGEPGTNGTTYYTWIRWADSPTSGMSVSPVGKAYMGIAENMASPTPSTKYLDYKWVLVKGDQGIPGTKGDDGTTYYIWQKYADTPTSGMSDDPKGKKYLGLAVNKTTDTESTNYADYSWSLLYDEEAIIKVITDKTAQIKTDLDNIKLAVTEKVSSNAIVAKDGLITISNQIKVYDSATNAELKTNSTGTYPASTYYVYEELNGMYNITSKQGTAGKWINPSEGVGPMQTLSERMSTLEQLVTSITMNFSDMLKNTSYVFDGDSARFYGALFELYDNKGNLIFQFDGANLNLANAGKDLLSTWAPDGLKFTTDKEIVLDINHTGIRGNYLSMEEIDSPSIVKRIGTGKWTTYDIYISDFDKGLGTGIDADNASSTFQKAWGYFSRGAKYLDFVNLNVHIDADYWVENLLIEGLVGNGYINFMFEKPCVWVGYAVFNANFGIHIEIDGTNVRRMFASPFKALSNSVALRYTASMGRIVNLNIDAKKMKTGISASHGAVIDCRGNDILWPETALKAELGGKIFTQDNIGSAYQLTGNPIAGGGIYAVGKVPACLPRAPVHVAQKNNDGTVTLIAPLYAYLTSEEAAANATTTKQYSAGSYYLFKETNSMWNISKTAGQSGAWINPLHLITLDEFESGYGGGVVTNPGGSTPTTPTGNPYDKIVNFAKSQIGEYGGKVWDWAFGGYDAWCAAFISWLGTQMGYDSKGWPSKSNTDQYGWVPSYKSLFGSHGRTFTAGSEQEKPGDLYFISGRHIGMVGEVKGLNNFKSVEGNYTDSNLIESINHNNDPQVSHFLRPDYAYFENKEGM